MNTSYDSYLGLTKEQTLTNNQKISYDYSSQGTKLKRESTQSNGTVQTTHYVGSFEYEQIGTASPTLSMIHLPGGKAIPNANGVKYEYYLTDHLGNVRMVFDNNNGEARIVQQSHYYPFGLTQTLYDNASQNKYLYNGKELESTGLYDIVWRKYDPINGRFTTNDKLAEKYFSYSAFNFVLGNPVSHLDPNGMEVFIDGEDAKKATKELDKSSSLRIKRDKKTGELSAKGKAKTDYDKKLQEAIQSKSVRVNLTATKSNSFISSSGEKRDILLGAFGGSKTEQNQRIDPDSDFPHNIETRSKTFAQQYVNIDQTQKNQDFGGSPVGNVVGHEINEAYIAGDKTPGTNTPTDNKSKDYLNYFSAHTNAMSIDPLFKEPSVKLYDNGWVLIKPNPIHPSLPPIEKPLFYSK